MPEPWDIKKQVTRVADTVETFIIFCEDEHHEPSYFKSFEKPGKVKVNPIGNQKQAKLNLNNTVHDCCENGLMTFEDNRYQLKQGITQQLWCVYDRDLESSDLSKIRPADNVDFDTAIQTAEGTGLKVAWSNDAFELWILLHFEQVPLGQMLHRDYIYDRLTTILRTIQPRTAELDALTANPLFNYKHSIKKRLRFDNLVLPYLRTRTSDAMANATALAAAYGSHVRFHERNPCTMVHNLVSAILSASV